MIGRLGAWGWIAVAIALLVAVAWAVRPAEPPRVVPPTPALLETLAPLPAANARAAPDPAAAIPTGAAESMPEMLHRPTDQDR